MNSPKNPKRGRPTIHPVNNASYRKAYRRLKAEERAWCGPRRGPQYDGLRNTAELFVGKVGEWIEDLNRALVNPANAAAVPGLMIRKGELFMLRNVLAEVAKSGSMPKIVLDETRNSGS